MSTISLKNKVAVITGGSRGIGRECCLALAREGCHIVIIAKSAKPKPGLPGSIYTVAEEVRALGVRALPLQVDVRDDKTIDAAIDSVVAEFGRGNIHILINNASALWWHDILNTPMKKYDLITQINARGTFAMTRACLPHMVDGKFGRVITMSPPIITDPSAYVGRTAYNISKYGMTIVALGVAGEYRDTNITGNALWPATIIESQASKNFQLGDTSLWRKATILADAVVGICKQDGDFTGNMLIDDEFLRDKMDFKDSDFVQYRCDPNVEPPRLLANEAAASSFMVKRGDVSQVQADIRKDNMRSNM